MGLCRLVQCIYTFILSPFYRSTFDSGVFASLRFDYNTVLGLRFRIPCNAARALALALQGTLIRMNHPNTVPQIYLHLGPRWDGGRPGRLPLGG